MVDVVTVHIPSLKADAGGSQDAKGQDDNKNDILKFFYYSGVVDSGGGSDILTFYGTCDVTIVAGSGNDRIDVTNMTDGSNVDVDGGSGTDVLDLPASWQFNKSIDWSAVRGVEWLRIWAHSGVSTRFVATNEMFGDIEHLTISSIRVGGSASGGMVLDGGAVTSGSMTLAGFEGSGDTIIGGGMDDIIIGRGGTDRLTGGAGDDRIDGGDRIDTAIFSGDMANYSLAYNYAAGKLTVTDNVGNDGADVLRNVDRIQFADQLYVVIDDNLTLVGTQRDDRLEGGTNDDRIDGRGGRDKLYGGYGNDLLNGGADADKIGGEVGDDTINGGGGDDTINGGAGSDIIIGNSGNDRIEDQATATGFSTIDGGVGDDRIEVLGGSVLVLGGEGHDNLYAGEAFGTVDGGADGDWIGFSITTSPDIADPSLLIIGGEGDDGFVGELDDGVTVLGGNGDDVMAAQHHSLGYSVDLGEGTDTVYANEYWEYKLRFDWAAIQNAEIIEVRENRWSSSVERLVILDDDIFINQDRWIVTAEYEKTRPVSGIFTIDASEVTEGYLEIIGRSMGKEALLGGALDDTIRGLSGDDFLTGNGGNDLLDGGEGYDFVVYDGEFADYAIDIQNGKVVVTALDGDDGTDTLVHIEVLRFDDKLVAL